MNVIEFGGMWLVLLVSVVLHEFGHGYAAKRCGDPTGREDGRLGFNPFPHLDPVGCLLLPAVSMVLVSFPVGYARPMPVDATIMRNRRRGMTITALAGPLVSFLLAVLFAGLFHTLLEWHSYGWFAGEQTGVLLGVLQYGVLFNLLWCGLNLVPFPPLDGFRLIGGWLPHRLNDKLERLSIPGALVLIGGFLLYSPELLDAGFFVLAPAYELLMGGVMIPYPG